MLIKKLFYQSNAPPSVIGSTGFLDVFSSVDVEGVISKFFIGNFEHDAKKTQHTQAAIASNINAVFFIITPSILCAGYHGATDIVFKMQKLI